MASPLPPPTARSIHWKHIVFGDDVFADGTYVAANVTINKFGQIIDIVDGTAGDDDRVIEVFNKPAMLNLLDVKQGDVIVLDNPKAIYQAKSSSTPTTSLPITEWQLINAFDNDTISSQLIENPTQMLRGTNDDLTLYVPASGEPVWNTDTDTLYIGDGVTVGGVEVNGRGSVNFPALDTTNDTSIDLPNPGIPNSGVSDGDIGGPLADGSTYIAKDGNWLPLSPNVVYNGVGASISSPPANSNQGDVLVDDDTGIVYKHTGGLAGDATDWQQIGSDSLIATGNSDDTTIGLTTEADLIAAPYKKGDIRVLDVTGGSLSAATYKAANAQSAVGDAADWLPIATPKISTGLVNTEVELVRAPYNQGDVRVLTISGGASLSGTYKATNSQASIGDAGDWQQISWDDYGVGF